MSKVLMQKYHNNKKCSSPKGYYNYERNNMTKIIEFPQLSELDKQYTDLEYQQKLIRDQKQLINDRIKEKKERKNDSGD